MRNRVVLAACAVAAAAALSGCGGLTPPGGAKPVFNGVATVGEFYSMGSTFELLTLPAMTVAVKDHTGPYLDVYVEVKYLEKWAATAGVALPGEVEPFAFYLGEYPEGPSEVPPEGPFFACIQVPEGTTPHDDPNVEIYVFPEPWTVAVREYAGTYDGIWDDIWDMYYWAQNNYAGEVGPAFHLFLTSPIPLPRSKVGVKLGPLPFPPPDTTDMPGGGGLIHLDSGGVVPVDPGPVDK